jgi:hypothetical protein
MQTPRIEMRKAPNGKTFGMIIAGVPVQFGDKYLTPKISKIKEVKHILFRCLFSQCEIHKYITSTKYPITWRELNNKSKFSFMFVVIMPIYIISAHIYVHSSCPPH